MDDSAVNGSAHEIFLRKLWNSIYDRRDFNTSSHGFGPPAVNLIKI